MRLRTMAVAAALGATVLTTVPAVTAPYKAFASCVDDHSSCGDEDPPVNEDPELPDPDNPSDPDNPGDPGDQGPVDAQLPTVVTNGTNISLAPVEVGPDLDVPTLNLVENATMPAAPEDPSIPSYSWGSDAGGGGGQEMAIEHSQGKKWEEHTNCYRNASSVAEKHTETISYNVTYQVSGNISAKAGDILSATLGTQINTQITKSYGLDVTLQPGESWSLFVEYQTKVYAITTFDWLSLTYKTEFVNVTAPTGVLTGRSC